MGVAGGELLIPTIVLLFGQDINLAGSLSLAVSLPTMLVAFARYSRDSSFVVLRENLRFVTAMPPGRSPEHWPAAYCSDASRPGSSSPAWPHSSSSRPSRCGSTADPPRGRPHLRERLLSTRTSDSPKLTPCDRSGGDGSHLGFHRPRDCVDAWGRWDLNPRLEDYESAETRCTRTLRPLRPRSSSLRSPPASPAGVVSHHDRIHDGGAQPGRGVEEGPGWPVTLRDGEPGLLSQATRPLVRRAEHGKRFADEPLLVLRRRPRPGVGALHDSDDTLVVPRAVDPLAVAQGPEARQRVALAVHAVAHAVRTQWMHPPHGRV